MPFIMKSIEGPSTVPTFRGADNAQQEGKESVVSQVHAAAAAVIRRCSQFKNKSKNELISVWRCLEVQGWGWGEAQGDLSPLACYYILPLLK